MTKYYCTFWYPTIFLEKATIRNSRSQDRVVEKSIADLSKHTFTVKLSIDTTKDKKGIATEDITIETTITEKKEDGNDIIVNFCVILNKLAKRSNGFIQYELDFGSSVLTEIVCNKIRELSKFKDSLNPIDDFREFFKSALSKPIYHYIKEFYHLHETITDKDSDLIAFCFENKDEYIPLDTTNNCNDNKYLQRFIEDFVRVFKDKAYQASELNSLLKNNISKITKDYGSDVFGNDKGILLKLEDFQGIPADMADKILKFTHQLDEICEDTLIEYIYCKTLLCSIYNRYYRHDTDAKLEKRELEISEIDNRIEELQKSGSNTQMLLDDKTKKERELINLKELRGKALNIRNAVRYIENIKYKNQNRQYLVSRFLLGKILEQNSKTEQVITKGNEILNTVQEKNERIENILNTGDKITKISIAIAVYGLLLTVLSIFEKTFENIPICTFNLHSLLLAITSIIFIIVLIIFIFHKHKIKKI